MTEPLTDDRHAEIRAAVARLLEKVARPNRFPADNESHWESEGWKNGTANAIAKLNPTGLLDEIGRLRARVAELEGAEPVPTDSRSAFMQLGRTTPQAVKVIFNGQTPIVGTYNGFHTGWRDERIALFDLKVAFPRPAKSAPAPEACDLPNPDNLDRGCVLTIGHRTDVDHQDEDGKSWPWATRY